MPNIVVVGAQWGDESKGKIVDLLAPSVEVVVRYSGGPNAGHTVKVGNQKYVFQQLPSGVLYPKKKNVLGNGMVLNPKTLCEEIASLNSRGALKGDLYISSEAHLILPHYPQIEQFMEEE